jgi:hypothetical protein
MSTASPQGNIDELSVADAAAPSQEAVVLVTVVDIERGTARYRVLSNLRDLREPLAASTTRASLTLIPLELCDRELQLVLLALAERGVWFSATEWLLPVAGRQANAERGA